MQKAQIVLLADGERCREVAAKFERASHLELFTTTSLEEARGAALRTRPHLVVVDAALPDAAGCCAALKGDGELGAMPLLALLPPGKREEAEALVEAGCDDCLLWPLASDHLFAKICSHIPQMAQRAARITYCAHVTIQDKEDVFYGVTGDISSGGLFVATFDRLPTEGDIRISFSLPDQGDSPIDARGRVVWMNSKKQAVCENRPEGFGVAFTSIAHENLSAIREFIAARLGR